MANYVPIMLSISILEIKDGWLTNTENYFSKKDEFTFDEELMESFLSKILIEKELENLTLLSDFKFKNLNTQLKEKKIHTNFFSIFAAKTFIEKNF